MSTTLSREEWLAARQQGVGASEAAPIAGLSPWDTALGVYLRKTGQAPEQENNSAMAWGLRLEPLVADAYAELTGRTVSTTDALLRHPEQPWMLATAGRVVVTEADEEGFREIDRLLELKTASVYLADEWGCPGTEDIPQHYLCQVQHQLTVARAVCRARGRSEPELCDIAVLIGGSDFRTYTVAYNSALAARLADLEYAFWHEHVLPRVPPEPDWSHDRTPGLIEALHGFAGGVVQLDDAAAQLVWDYEKAHEDGSSAGEVKSVAKAKLLHLMGEATLALLPDGTRITRKQIQRKEYTVQATSYVNFSIKHPEVPKEKETA